MSNVTNVILVTCGESDMAMELYGQFVEVDRMAGGNKYMECSVVMAAINYMDEDAFINDFKAMKWLSPECAQLMIKRQDDDVFTTYLVD